MFPKIKVSRNNKRSLLAATDAFEPASVDSISETSGNIQSLFEPQYRPDSHGKYQYRGGIFKNHKPFYDSVSAPYLLAKLVASYPGLQVSCEGQEGYKVTWTVALRHKETGAIITFYDWKGGASYGSNLGTELPASFKKDVTALLKALVDPRFPHPYDGCVIGEVA